LKSAPPFVNPSFAQNHNLVAAFQRVHDHCPFFEGRSHYYYSIGLVIVSRKKWPAPRNSKKQCAVSSSLSKCLAASDVKAAEDCRTPKPSELRALNCVAKRLGVRQSSAAFGSSRRFLMRIIFIVIPFVRS